MISLDNVIDGAIAIDTCRPELVKVGTSTTKIRAGVLGDASSSNPDNPHESVKGELTPNKPRNDAEEVGWPSREDKNKQYEEGKHGLQGCELPPKLTWAGLTYCSDSVAEL